MSSMKNDPEFSKIKDNMMLARECYEDFLEKHSTPADMMGNIAMKNVVMKNYDEVIEMQILVDRLQNTQKEFHEYMSKNIQNND